MALTFGDNISYQGKKPLDARMLFATISAMKSYSENYLPALAMCQNEEDENLYIYNVANTVDETTGKWRKFEGGGSTVTVTQTLTEGTEVAEITVDDESTKIYAPTQEKYTLPVASSTELGGVKVRPNEPGLKIDSDGVLSINTGPNINKYSDGTIGVNRGSTLQSGVLKVGDNIYVSDDGKDATIYINKATKDTPGVVQIGDYLNVTKDGVVSGNPNVVMGNYKYSTDERCIGEWIDGRPLYRKIVKSTLPAVTKTGVMVSKYDSFVTLVNDMISIKGFACDLNNNPTYYWNVEGYANASSTSVLQTASLVYLKSSKQIQITNSLEAWNNLPITIILEYTKTTDAANSFTLDKITTGDLDTVATDAEVTEVLG